MYDELVELEYFGRQRRDLLISALDDLARNWAKDTSAFWLLLRFIDQYNGVFIKTDVRTIFAAIRLGLADNDRAMNFFFLHTFARLCYLDREHYLVSDLRIAAAGTTQNLKDSADGSARVVCNFHDGLRLYHTSYSSS